MSHLQKHHDLSVTKVFMMQRRVIFYSAFCCRILCKKNKTRVSVPIGRIREPELPKLLNSFGVQKLSFQTPQNNNVASNKKSISLIYSWLVANEAFHKVQIELQLAFYKNHWGDTWHNYEEWLV